MHGRRRLQHNPCCHSHNGQQPHSQGDLFTCRCVKPGMRTSTSVSARAMAALMRSAR